jgi:hypothetical protein
MPLRHASRASQLRTLCNCGAVALFVNLLIELGEPHSQMKDTKTSFGGLKESIAGLARKESVEIPVIRGTRSHSPDAITMAPVITGAGPLLGTCMHASGVRAHQIHQWIQ